MYYVISTFILLVSILLFKRVAGSLKLKKLNMISWIFYFPLITQSFVAAVLVVNGIDNHYVINRVGDEARFYGWLSVQYTMLALPLGMIVAQNLNGISNNRNLFNTYLSKSVETTFSHKDSYIKFPLYALSFIALLAVFYTFSTLDNIPLKAALSFDHNLNLAKLRQLTSHDYSGNVYIKNIFAIGLTPVITYIAFSYWKLSKSGVDLIWFLIMFTASLLILTMDLQKAPFIIFILGFLFLLVLFDDGVSKKYLYFFGASLILLLIFAYFIVKDNVDIWTLFSYNTGIGGRIFLSQAAGIFLTFENFPDTHPFIGFSSISGLINDIFGQIDSDRSARIIMSIFKPKAVEAGEAGVMNTLFIAEAWANFGLLGVIVAPIYVGFIIQIMFIFFLKSKKTPLMLGLLSYLSYSLPLTGGFNDFLYNPQMMSILFIFATIYATGFFLQRLKN